MTHLLDSVREVRQNASLPALAKAATLDAQRAHHRMLEGFRSEDKAEGLNARMEAHAWTKDRCSEFNTLKDLATHLRRLAKLEPWDYDRRSVQKSEESE